MADLSHPPVEFAKPRRFWEQLWIEQQGVCPLCLRAMPFDSDSVDVDHKVPKSKGGGEEMSNLQAVHTRCNLIKKARSDAEARERIATMIASGEY